MSTILHVMNVFVNHYIFKNFIVPLYEEFSFRLKIEFKIYQDVVSLWKIFARYFELLY